MTSLRYSEYTWGVLAIHVVFDKYKSVEVGGGGVNFESDLNTGVATIHWGPD